MKCSAWLLWTHNTLNPCAQHGHNTYIYGRSKPYSPTSSCETDPLHPYTCWPGQSKSGIQHLTLVWFIKDLAPWVTHSTHMLFPNEGHLKHKATSNTSALFSWWTNKKKNNLSISCSQINLAIVLRKLKQIEPVCQLEHSACCLLWLLLYIGLKLNVKQRLAQTLHDCP